MIEMTILEKRKRKNEYMKKYYRTAIAALQFVRNLQNELLRTNKFLFIPVEMYNEELLGRFWRIQGDHFENKLELVEGKKHTGIRPITTEQLQKEIQKVQGERNDKQL